MTAQSVVLVDLAKGISWSALYSGTFGTTISGDITGTVTGFTYAFKTTSIFLTITGLSLSAEQVFAAVSNHDVAGLSAMLFAGDDVFNAQVYAGFLGTGQIIDGFTGNDLIYGSRGKDELTGGTGKDSLYGAMSTDTLLGGAGDDLLFGESGADVLTGGPGRDLLSGGWEADTLQGGLGADQIYGGLGADLFIWKTLRDSTVANAGRDTVQDFAGADGDRIDLSGIDAKAGVRGNQAFVLVSAFSHHAGELRVQSTSEGSVVFGDTDGDGSADFSIGFLGVTSFPETTFVL